ncbi:MAG: hypothetical protein JSR58_03975 [Verrucomicrobia bacterium]|nr:hypothetical protein [Verrucomicrobiota bacterium]
MKYLIFLLGCLISLTGCSSKTSLGYTSVIEKQQPNHISLKLQEFEDQRTDGQNIGSIRNGYGMTIIRIFTDDSIPDWVANALKTELTNAGYTIVSGDTPSDYSIEGKIKKLYATTYLIYHGRMSVEITLKKGQDVIFQKLYETDKDNGVNWMGQTASCAETLKINLQEICRRFDEDIKQALLVPAALNPL